MGAIVDLTGTDRDRAGVADGALLEYALRTWVRSKWKPVMPEVSWYYARNDQQFGPVSPAELRQLASARALAPEDLIWREGMEGWAPAAKVKGLFPENREPAVASAPASNGQTETMPPTAVAAILSLAPSATPTPTPSAAPAPVATDVFLAQELAAIAEPRPGEPSHNALAVEPATGWQLMDLMWVGQTLLWAICIGTVFVGGLLFTRALATAEDTVEKAAAAAIFATFFIGAYILARAGERVAMLLQIYFERKRKT